MDSDVLLGQPARRARYAVVDLEMTGLDPDRDQICEIGIVLMEQDDVVETWSSLVRPEVPMSPGARRVHGITDEELSVAPHFEDVAPTLDRLLDRAILVGHRVDFDLAFLTRAQERASMQAIDPPMVDTLEVARRLFAFRSNRLGSICAALDVPQEHRHRALSDATATAACLRGMLALIDPDDAMSVADVLGHIQQLGPEGAIRDVQLAALQQAYESRRTVWIDYLSKVDGEGYAVSRREVRIWHLAPPRMQGWCHLREEERVFRLERIRHVEPGTRSYRVPDFRIRIEVRVAHVCRVAPPGIGGMEAVIAGLSAVQADAGMNVRVVTLDDDRRGGVALHPGVERIALRRLGPRRYPFALGLWRALSGADLVHVHGVDGLADQVLAHPRRPWAVGISTHGGFLHTRRDWLLKHAWLRTWTRFSLARADAIWFTSESDRVRLEPGLPRGEIVPNGVELDDLLVTPRRPEQGRFLVFGRVDVHKGLPRLADALASYATTADFVVRIVGEEAREGLFELIESHARRLGVWNRVQLVGAVDRAAVREELSRCELALFPSRAEGFGLSLVEAQAAGVPVLAQPLPAYRSKIDDGRSGFLVDFDHPSQVVSRLASMRGARGAWSEEAARNAGSRWSWHAMASRWSRAYARVLEAR